MKYYYKMLYLIHKFIKKIQSLITCEYFYSQKRKCLNFLNILNHLIKPSDKLTNWRSHKFTNENEEYRKQQKLSLQNRVLSDIFIIIINKFLFQRVRKLILKYKYNRAKK